MSSETKKKRANPNKNNPRLKSCYVGKYAHVFGKMWTNDELSALADELSDWMEADVSHYWIEEFLLEKHIPSSSFYDQLKKHDYLREVYELCKMRREMVLAKASMFDDCNASGIIFALKNKCGWKDKQEIDIDNNLPEAVSFEWNTI